MDTPPRCASVGCNVPAFAGGTLCRYHKETGAWTVNKSPLELRQDCQELIKMWEAWGRASFNAGKLERSQAFGEAIATLREVLERY